MGKKDGGEVIAVEAKRERHSFSFVEDAHDKGGNSGEVRDEKKRCERRGISH